MHDLQGFIGPAEAARQTGYSTVTLKHWALTGRHGLRYVRVAGRMVFRASDIAHRG